ncbi:MAG: CD1247 N-terminal domain-containing protein [Ruthenibacterium lactatiformans]
MELKEKVAYIKGMMEGMEFDTATKEGKLLAAVVDVLEEMAKEVTNIDEDVDTLYDEVDAMSEDLEDVENFLFDEDGGDEDEDDYDEEYEAGLYEITARSAARLCAWMRICWPMTIWPAPTAARSLRSTSARTTTPAKAVKAAAAARTKNKRIPGTKRRKSPSARRAEGLFCFVGMQGEAQKGEGAPVLFTPVFYRAACVRQYTA